MCVNEKVLYRSKMPRIPEILRVEISYLSMVDGRETERRVPETLVIVAAVGQHVGRAVAAHYERLGYQTHYQHFHFSHTAVTYLARNAFQPLGVSNIGRSCG
jgi:hypothetical protein